MKKIFYMLLGAILIAPGIAGAAYFAADNYVSPQKAIESDIYAAGQNVSLRQPVGQDAFVAGNLVEVMEKVGHSVFAAGQSVTVKGDVGHNIYSAGNAVEIAAPRLDDLFAAGNSLKIGKETTVSGDAYLAGQNITIAGKVLGTARIAASTITLEPGSEIKGSLITYGAQKPTVTVSEGAKVLGEQKHVTTAGVNTDKKEASSRMELLGWVRNVLTWFVVALILLYLMPLLTRNVVSNVSAKPLPTLGLGILWLLLFIPAFIFLLLTIIGMPLAFVVLAATVVFILMAVGYESLLVGVWTMRHGLKQTGEAITWQHALLGAVLLAIIGIIPIIGPLFGFVLFLMALGSVIMAITQALHRKEA